MDSDLEALRKLIESGGEGARVIMALVHRILAIQEEVDETQLLRTVAYVEALLSGEGLSFH